MEKDDYLDEVFESTVSYLIIEVKRFTEYHEGASLNMLLQFLDRIKDKETTVLGVFSTLSEQAKLHTLTIRPQFCVFILTIVDDVKGVLSKKITVKQ